MDSDAVNQGRRDEAGRAGAALPNSAMMMGKRRSKTSVSIPGPIFDELPTGSPTGVASASISSPPPPPPPRTNSMASIDPISPRLSQYSSLISASDRDHDRDRFSQALSEAASLPELERDGSTEDMASDYLSTGNASLIMGDDSASIEMDHHNIAGARDLHELHDNDDTSMYTPPNQYPQVPISIRGEVGNEDDATIDSTRSLNPLDLPYVVENGRCYCGPYYMPVDEEEQIRLHLVHQVYLRSFDGELTSVRLEDPTHILDVGSGAGDWAMAMADRYRDCDIVGTDICDIFAAEAPINCNWEIDDAELEWNRPSDYYDLVHFRNMAGAFKDWDHIYRSTLDCLKPGGSIEILDYDHQKNEGNFHSWFRKDSVVHTLDKNVHEASIESGRYWGMAHLEPRLLMDIGYTDVRITEHAIPLRVEDGDVGKLWLVAILESIEASCLRVLTTYKGWTAEEVRRVCFQVCQEMMELVRDPEAGKGFCIRIRVITARKPAHPRNRPADPTTDGVHGQATRRPDGADQNAGSPD